MRLTALQSVTIGVDHETLVSHEVWDASTITSMHGPKTAGVPSTTTTSNEHSALLPFVSVAVYVTVVLPSKKMSPGRWELVVITLPQLSAMTGSTQLTAA
jgi:hypothetical protein